jgi:phosphoglycerate dehydrogenase-like enzyme
MAKLRLHIENLSHRPAVYHITSERWAAAATRRPELAQSLDVTIGWDGAGLDAALGDADIAIGIPSRRDDLRARAPRLRWLHHTSAGVDSLLPLDWLPPDVALTNNRGAHGSKAEQYMRMAYTALNIALPRMMSNQQACRWEQVFSPSLVGQTAVIIGLGDLGKAAARAARQLGMTVVGVRRHAKPCEDADRVVTYDALDEVLATADYVVLAVPLTAETRRILDARRIGLLKPTAGVINIARAAVADYDALRAALVSDKLGGAFLDVVEPEPLPADSPLWQTRNLIITPHISCDDADNYVAISLDLWFRNLERYLRGEPLAGCVDGRLGY